MIISNTRILLLLLAISNILQPQEKIPSVLQVNINPERGMQSEFIIIPDSNTYDASEHILSFVSDIRINADASLLIRETIIVKSTGKKIIHGIVREFPMRYQSKITKTNYIVDFDIHEITQDGKPAEYFIKNVYNGKEIYIGSKDVFLPSGEHIYTIVYSTQRQLGFFADHDELYWNVTGNGWQFPIDQAKAIVHIPLDIPIEQVQVYAYTGKAGSIEQNYTVSIDNHDINYTTTNPLRRYEGLTIVVGWPKGFVVEPFWYKKFYWFLRDNILLFMATLWIFILLFWYLFWSIRIYFRNKSGIIIPLFYPPENMSPSAIGFVEHRSFKDTFLAVDIVDLAVYGWVTITYSYSFLSSTYTLTCAKNIDRLEQDTETNTYQKKLIATLFAKGNTVILNRKNRTYIKNTIGIIKQYTKQKYSHYIDYCLFLHSVAVCISIIGLIVCILSPDEHEILFLVIPAAIAIHLLMIYSFRAYTPEGQKVRNAIDGFKLFLNATEKERLKFISTPPTQTPELYEKYLPYAMVLGIEEQWTQQFTSLFTRLEHEGRPYKPIWYIGRPFKSTSFASHLHRTLKHTISSSVTPPGSKSGFGKSGGSGGGGGGGGGRGW
ncbi:MAG TPA: DUF2207 domain-containing protein [Candidatus Babeliales bacterium]|jgi:hypothetical protein|nr:DUF2207 domain-containing protein [Candidatus Babeliales bacterium]